MAPYISYAQNQGVKVFIVDENIDSSSIEKKYEVTKQVELPNVLPDRQKREKVFRSIDIPKDWDELSKDIFYSDLKSKSIRDLTKKYPNFKEEDLKNLKGKIK